MVNQMNFVFFNMYFSFIDDEIIVYFDYNLFFDFEDNYVF
jgi:hypothetical protein